MVYFYNRFHYINYGSILVSYSIPSVFANLGGSAKGDIEVQYMNMAFTEC